MGMPGRLGFSAGVPLAAGVGGEGLLDDGGEVGVAAAQEDVAGGLVLELGFEALGAEGE